MSKTTYDIIHDHKMNCKDCGYETISSVEFNEHVHECKVNPVLMPSGEVERRKVDNRK